MAAVDDTGKPTGFVDEMVTLFRPSLENILANAAELDWRSATTDGAGPVLGAVWRDLLHLLPTASNRQRAELVERLKRAAIFAPEEVLQICEWLIGHPEAPKDELLEQWGLEDSPDKVSDALTDVIALIGTHPHFTKRCAAQLWILAVRDERPTNPYPSHPRRRLADLVKYEPRTDWESADGVQVKAIEFFTERLRSASRDRSATWAVSALAGALARTGEANESNRRVFTLREFSLATFAPQLAERRAAVIQCLVEIALGDRLDEAAAALSELSSLLKAPRGPFGRGLDATEIAVWQTEAEKAISLLQKIAQSDESVIVRFLARRELRSTHQDHWPQIAPEVQKALKESTPVPGERLYDLLIGIPWEEQLDDWAAEDARVEQLSVAAAQAFWHEHNSPAGLIQALLSAMSAFSGIGRGTESQAGPLIRALVLTSPHDPREFVHQLAAREPGWSLLRPALLAVHEKDPQLAESLASELSLAEHEVVRASALDAVQWMVDRAADLAALIDLTQTLSQDPAPLVRGVSARVLRRLAKRAPTEALAILTTIDWDGILWLGDAVLAALDPTHGLDPNQLSDASIDMLLARIERLQTLEGRSYEVLEFIGFASKRRPAQTVEMLLRRVQAIDEHQEKKGADRWQPMPYSGRGVSLPGVHDATNHLELVRLVRDASLGATSMADFWLPVLFQVTDPNLVAGRVVLREWIASGDRQRIVAAASLLKAFDHSIVFSEHELICDLLVAANNFGDECLQDVRGELFSLAGSGVYSGTPGQPAPRHVQDKKEAERFAEAYSGKAPVQDFYRSLVARAEAHMRFDVALWDEEGDEE
jgi:hypothetical protein